MSNQTCWRTYKCLGGRVKKHLTAKTGKSDAVHTDEMYRRTGHSKYWLILFIYKKKRIVKKKILGVKILNIPCIFYFSFTSLEEGNFPTTGYHMAAAVSSSNRWTSLQQFINFLLLSFSSSLAPNHKSWGVRPGQRDKKLSGNALAHFCGGNKTTLTGCCALERATGSRGESKCVSTSDVIRTCIFLLLQYI